ncbi:MAG: deoxyuridine 5'-triphosphate nucleotidohydrolase, partial [Chloroflexota bacterium]
MTESTAFPGVLSAEVLRERILGYRPLLTGWCDLDTQVQPNGFDLSLLSVSSVSGRGQLGASNTDRVLPDYAEMPFGSDGYLDLDPGIYQVVFAEIVDLPNDLMALGRPRSSLCRSGVTLHTSVWDAGYRGRSTALLQVINPAGFRVQRGARRLHLVFFGMGRAAGAGYARGYQPAHTGDQAPAGRAAAPPA